MQMSRHALPDGSGDKLLLHAGGERASFRAWLSALAVPEFALAWSAALADSPWPGLYWECPHLDAAALDRPFECVLLPASGLAGRAADASAFAQYLRRTPERAVRFENLGGDAWLIAPAPAGQADFGHLGAFLREACAADLCALWAALAEHGPSAIEQGYGWFNTAGDGVPWLHLRLDARPKYYQHRAYRAAMTG